MYIYLVQITKNQWQWQRSERKKKSRNQSKNGEMKMNWINELSDSACLDNWTEKQHWTDGNWWMRLDVVAIQLHKNYVYSFDNKHTDQPKKNTQTQKGKWIYNMHTYNAKHNYPRAFGKMYRIFFILVYFNHRHGTNKRELRRGRDFWLNYHHRKTKEQEIEHMRTTWTLNHCVK